MHNFRHASVACTWSSAFPGKIFTKMSKGLFVELCFSEVDRLMSPKLHYTSDSDLLIFT